MTLEFDGAGDHLTYTAMALSHPLCAVAWVYVDNSISDPNPVVIWCQDGNDSSLGANSWLASLMIHEDDDPAPGSPLYRCHIRHKYNAKFKPVTANAITAYNGEYDKWVLVGGLWTSKASRKSFIMVYGDTSTFDTTTNTTDIGTAPPLDQNAYIGIDGSTNTNGEDDFDGHIGCLYVGEHTMTDAQFKQMAMGWSPFSVFSGFSVTNKAYWELDERGPTTGTTPDFFSKGRDATFPGSGNDPTASAYPPPFRRQQRVVYPH
jgi:hypothetical protein